MRGLVPSDADDVWAPESLARHKRHGGSVMGALREQLVMFSVSIKETPCGYNQRPVYIHCISVDSKARRCHRNRDPITDARDPANSISLTKDLKI